MRDNDRDRIESLQTPRPAPFDRSGAADHSLWLARIEGAVDEVVEAAVALAAGTPDQSPQHTRRLAGASYRLWALTNRPHPARRYR
jgi:hypothetical protein